MPSLEGGHGARSPQDDLATCCPSICITINRLVPFARMVALPACTRMPQGLVAVNISLKLYSIYRSMLPPDSQRGEIMLEIAEGTSVRSLLKEFGIPTDESSVVLVNGQTVDLDGDLQEGDAVSAFPAMAGGCRQIQNSI